MEYMDPFLIQGDYLVVEDGGVALLPEPQYRQYESGPTRAVDALLATRADACAVDRSLCDFWDQCHLQHQRLAAQALTSGNQ
jgi:cephalosporin hydroxylase